MKRISTPFLIFVVCPPPFQEKLIDGELPYVDERYRTRSYGEGRLVEIMERCWVYEPEKRATIFEVVEFLRETLAEHKRREVAGARR